MKKLHPLSKYRHYCIEWDYMLIDETDPEISCCLCFDDEEFKNIRKREQNRQEFYRLNYLNS